MYSLQLRVYHRLNSGFRSSGVPRFSSTALPTALVSLSVTCQEVLSTANSGCFVSTVRTYDVMTANQNTAHVICFRVSIHPLFNDVIPTHHFVIQCRFEIISPLFTGRN